MKYSKEEIAKMRLASNLIEPPAAQIIGELLDEIERLQDRWIPESEAPINQRVYVLMPNNYVVIATKFKSLCKDPNHYLWRNDSGAICQVICWMPLPLMDEFGNLPQPPEEGE